MGFEVPPDGTLPCGCCRGLQCHIQLNLGVYDALDIKLGFNTYYLKHKPRSLLSVLDTSMLFSICLVLCHAQLCSESRMCS